MSRRSGLPAAKNSSHNSWACSCGLRGWARALVVALSSSVDRCCRRDDRERRPRTAPACRAGRGSRRERCRAPAMMAWQSACVRRGECSSTGSATSSIVACEPQHDRARGEAVRREPGRDRRAGGDIGLIEQPHGQLGVVPLLVRRVRRTAQVLVGQDSQQRRPDIDALAIEVEQAFEPRWCQEIYHRATPGIAAPGFLET